MGLNGAVSGVVSRKVLPACGGLCYFCPSLRPRSRQPVKRYKKIIADIFPSAQVRNSFPPSRPFGLVDLVPWFCLLAINCIPCLVAHKMALFHVAEE
jgi:hypothetical protein